MPVRRWTQLGVSAGAGHLAYELLNGAAVPLATLGAGRVVAGYGAGTAGLCWAASKTPLERGGRGFSVTNGLLLSAVIGHFTSWPRTTHAGLPWLTECEGLSGRAMPAYNALLYASAVFALGGLVEHRRHWQWGAVVPLLAVPVLRYATPRHYQQLLRQAACHPRWWNRRLTAISREQTPNAVSSSTT